MATLTNTQKNFLNTHSIELSEMFDATGMKRAEIKLQMELESKKFTYGDTPCVNAGHTLRNLTGKCIQCSPASIEFQRRYFAEAFVYIANSDSINFIKIGVTNNLLARQLTLNKSRYAGVSDWSLVYYAQAPNAGRVENNLQKELREHQVFETYVRNGIDVTCNELFNFPLNEAISLLDKLIESNEQI